jgi:nitrite reductase/ring-hydroxylating ferredoxin subunit
MLPAAPGVYEFLPDHVVLRCSRPRREFKLATGRSFTDPKHLPVRVYAVEVVDGDVLLNIEVQR